MRMPSKSRTSLFAALAACGLLVAACGGGGGDTVVAAPPAPVVPPVVRTTAISGTVSALVSPSAALPNLAGPANMLVAPGAGTVGLTAIVQQMDFMLDLSALPATPVASAVIYGVRAYDALLIGIGTGYPGDGTLGRWTSFDPGISPTTPNSLVSQPRPIVFNALDTSGPVPSADYSSAIFLPYYNLSYVPPLSATLNPAGYTFQTFGQLSSVDTTPGGPWNSGRPASEWSFVDAWFSVGIPTDPVSIPTVGTASYVGVAVGTAVNAATRDMTLVSATVNATVDFAARSIAWSTSGTGASAMSGVLAYIAGSNTFSGTIASASGLIGNATCRFYGPGIGAATASKVIGSPNEIGCTFALGSVGVGAMQGALAAN